MLESPSQSRSRYGSFDVTREVSVPKKPKKPAGQQMKEGILQFGRIIDRLFPNFSSVDAMAYSLAKHTPRMLAASLVLLAICIGGSLAHITAVDFLWGIPALSALCIGFGFMACTSTVMLCSGLSDEARVAAKGAYRLQWGIVAAGGLTVLYFVGMAFQLW